MIGILGPRDSVTLVLQVASELGRSDDILTLAYEDVDEAVGLGRTLEPMCDVLLFTGVVPFERAKRSGAWKCELDVILHSHADLYRVIGLVLKESGGEFPRVSVDSIDADAVRQVFVDMDLPAPDIVIPVVDQRGGLVFEDVEGTAQAHLAALEHGDVDAALTCLDGTHRLLSAAGAKAWRVDHARITIVEALQRAWFASEMKRTKGNSIAIALLKSESSGRGPRGKVDEAREAVERAVATHSRRMGSRVAMQGDRYMLTTTRAAIEETLDRFRNGQRSLVDLATRPPTGIATTLGVGFGGTFATALDSAEKAFQMARSSGEPTVVREDGTVQSLVSGPLAETSLQETSAAILKLSEQTGLGPLSLRRLVAALNRADPTAVTAQQLGELYGVTQRSARRMLFLLVSAGYAREAGVRGAASAGRPHVVYDVDLPGLSRVMASSAGKTPKATRNGPTGGRSQ